MRYTHSPITKTMIQKILSIIFFILLGQIHLKAQIDTLPPPPPFPMETPPEAINLREIQSMIRYPLVAREMNLEGNLIFRILIDENGNYVKHIPPPNGHPIFIKEVEKYIPQLKFKPLIENGHAMKFWVQLPFNFKLDIAAKSFYTPPPPPPKPDNYEVLPDREKKKY